MRFADSLRKPQIDRLGRLLRSKYAFLNRRKTEPECLLALDIGTEFVKTLVFKIKEGAGNEEQGSGVVLGAGCQRQEPSHMLAGAVADIDGVALTCQKAIEEAVRAARARPKRAVMGVAGEFVKGATNSFIYKRKHPKEEIGLAELQNVIQKVQWRAFDKARSRLALETCRSEVEIKPINALLTDVRIDGYQVTNPLGFQGKEIFLSIFNVYTPIVHLKALESIASKLNLDLLSIVAESYALTKCSNCNSPEGVIFIDIGGGTTDVALVRQGRVEGIKSVSLGGRAFTKRIGQKLGLGFAEAEALKMKYSGGLLGTDVQEKIRSILDKDAEMWLKGVELVLEDFEQDRPMPFSIFLCGGGSLLPGIGKVLQKRDTRERWAGNLSFEQPIQVSFMRPKHIKNITDGTDSLRSAGFITPLALAGLALEIALDEKKALPPVLRRVLRIMR